MCAAGGGELVPIRQGSQPITGPAGSVVHESVINILNRQRAPIWKAWGVKKAAAAMVNNRGRRSFFVADVVYLTNIGNELDLLAQDGYIIQHKRKQKRKDHKIMWHRSLN